MMVRDIAFFDLEPIRGNETNKTRPCLVVAVPTPQTGYAKSFHMVVALPMTKVPKNFWTEIPILKKGDMTDDSYVLCHQIRALDLSRARDRIAQADDREMKRVKQVLKIMLDT